jgi:RNA-binding protein NOB1
MSYFKRPALEKQVDEDGWEIATNQKRAPAKKYTPKKTKKLPTPVKEEEQEEKKEEEKKEEEKKEEEKKEEEKKEEEKKDEEVKHITESIEKIDIQEPVLEQVTSQPIPLTEDDSDSDGGEWITPDNVDEYKAAEIGVTADEIKKRAVMAVGCMTADFAMQNVLLQMNLNLVSAGGYRVKKIRNSVMRCHACFW